MNRKRKKKSYGVLIFGLIVVIVACIGLGIFLAKDQIKTVVKEKAAKYAISQAIKTELGEDVNVDKFIDQMEPEDEKVMNQLMDKYVNDDTINEYVGLLKDGGIDAVKDYVGQMADESDITNIEELFQKYKDTVIP